MSFLVPFTGWPGSNNSKEHTEDQVLVFMFCLPLREPGLCGEMVNLRSGAENVKREPGTCCWVRKQKNIQRGMRCHDRDLGAELGTPCGTV